MNYIEYKIGEIINDNSDDIVRFLQDIFIYSLVQRELQIFVFMP